MCVSLLGGYVYYSLIDVLTPHTLKRIMILLVLDLVFVFRRLIRAAPMPSYTVELKLTPARRRRPGALRINLETKEISFLRRSNLNHKYRL